MALISGGPAFALEVFTDRLIFESANHGLITENFETNALGSTTSKTCPSPLDNNSDNTCFEPGNLNVGAEYGLPESPAGTQLALETAIDTLTARIGANSASDFLVVRFSDPGITAAGLDLSCTNSPRAGTVRFYGINGLITEQAVNCSDTGNFIATSGDEQIVRIEAEAPGTFEFVDNVIFGNATFFTAYTNRDDFEATYTFLSKEDFESGDLGGSGSRACPSPLDASSDNECFSSGDLAPGVEYRIQDNPLISQLGLSGPKPGRSITLGPNGFSDFLIASFSDSRTTAVGLDLYCLVNPGIISVRFFSANGLITERNFDCSTSVTFIGIAANKHINYLEVELDGDYEHIDNLLFGRAALELMFKDDFE
jgi:hypothetical protein